MARGFFKLLRGAAEPAGGIVPDGELLRRHALERDASAVELLLRRHADSVWAACRRILPSDADAEDAFQATFLSLLEHAGAIRGSCAGAWLHRVAVHASLKLRPSARRFEPMPPDTEFDANAMSPSDAADRREQNAIVQSEVARLPERYRLPIVLCDLEGQSHAEAAAMLNWPVGSVSGRLSRAHALLRERLARLGVAPAIAGAALAGFAPPLSAIERLMNAITGASPVSGSVSNLVRGVAAAMKLAKLKSAVLLVGSFTLIAVVGIGSVFALSGTAPPEPNPASPPAANAPAPPEPPIDGDWIPKKDMDEPPTAFPNLKPLDPKQETLTERLPGLYGPGALAILPSDDTYRRLLKARLYQGSREILKLRMRIDVGSYQSMELPGYLAAQDDMRAATVELWQNDRKELAPRLEEFLLLARDMVRITRARVQAGVDPPQQLHTAERHRLKVEADLWKALHPK